MPGAERQAGRMTMQLQQSTRRGDVASFNQLSQRQVRVDMSAMCEAGSCLRCPFKHICHQTDKRDAG